MNQMPGGVARAPIAGRGMGNIPNAPGALSGKFAPQLQNMVPKPEMGMDGAEMGPPGGMGGGGMGDEPPGGMGGGPPGGGAVPQGPGMQQPTLDPNFFFDFHATLMNALLAAADSDQGLY